MVLEMEEMGYTRAESLEALRATNWNLDEALDRLEGSDENDSQAESGSQEYPNDVCFR